jgi:hypothetical protein
MPKTKYVDGLMLLALGILMMLSALTPVLFYVAFSDARESSLRKMKAEIIKEVEARH